MVRRVYYCTKMAIATGIIILMLCKKPENYKWENEVYVAEKTKASADTVGYSVGDAKVFRNFDHALNLIRFGRQCQRIGTSVESAVFSLRGESGLIPKVFSYISPTCLLQCPRLIVCHLLPLVFSLFFIHPELVLVVEFCNVSQIRVFIFFAGFTTTQLFLLYCIGSWVKDQCVVAAKTIRNAEKEFWDCPLGNK